MPCTIQLLPTPKSEAGLFDCDEYNSLLRVASPGRTPGATADSLQAGRIAAHQRQLLGVGPALDLPLASHSRLQRLAGLGVRQADRSAQSSVKGAAAVVVGDYARRHIVGVTDVQRAVGTEKDVDEVLHADTTATRVPLI